MRSQNNSKNEERNKLCSIWRPKSHRDRLIFAKSLCIIVAICAIALTFVYMQTINEIKASKAEAISILKEERFDQVYLYAMELRKMAKDQAGDVAILIEQDIRSEMDLDELKLDLDNNIKNEDLHIIFRKNISNVQFNNIKNQRNGVFITSMEEVLEDMNYHRASEIDESVVRDWEHEINCAYNSDLERNAVIKLINHSSEVIMTEHVNRIGVDDSNYKNHIMLTSSGYESIKAVYMEEGMNGLKNYQFLNPAYILDTEDIFGQQGLIEGSKQDTHTFIVVQEFNLYDQIETHYPDLMDTTFTKQVEVHYDHMLNVLYVVGIFYMVILVLLLSMVSNKYNNYFDKYDLGSVSTQKNKKEIKNIE